jgi:hypothetical protein
MRSTPEGRQTDGASDRRWVVLADDGGYVTLGRARDPSDEEIARAEQQLVSMGRGGWLAIQSHSIYSQVFPGFLEVRRLGEPVITFAEAVEALRSASKES